MPGGTGVGYRFRIEYLVAGYVVVAIGYAHVGF